ncbi:DNA-binding MarR family transcriptional regulator [Streptomyces zagrosensis]|uniref:DNA-binding MarR family transcriptional regulator n=2 Tax=Streptomyces zagrosensis TaxID=1042984 RepID=A0A7W9QB84_9ACTN|nr:DNA-binding MarR family transcriptional regulator [Streptomyces zagrosensis]
MEGKRPAATAQEAQRAMDHFVGGSHIGQQEIARRLGLNSTDLTCFGYVLEAGVEPLTAGDLAERAHVTTGAVTGILNRLERAGFVLRQPDPEDRRRVRIVAEPAALTRVYAVYEPFYGRLAELYADYSPDEIAVLRDFFQRADALVRGYLEETRHSAM